VTVALVASGGNPGGFSLWRSTQYRMDKEILYYSIRVALASFLTMGILMAIPISTTKAFRSKSLKHQVLIMLAVVFLWPDVLYVTLCAAIGANKKR